MKTSSFIIVATIALFIASCGGGGENSATAASAETSTDTGKVASPVETKSPNTNYKPAFQGQTRVAGVKTTTPYQSVVLTSDLKNPWGITLLPDGRFLITEKGGNVRIVSATGSIGSPLNGIPKVNSDGQGGLLGICLDPAFDQNRMVYWAFSEDAAEGTLTAVAKGKESQDEKSMEGVKVIYRATPRYKGNLHYGGRVLFDKNGNLFVSTGERSDREIRTQAQNLNAGLGKIIRITTDGQPVKGNPFEGQQGARPELYSYGHRNVQGISIHPQTGELWDAEFGPKGGDELNRVEPGKNYGWPVITYGIEYAGDKVGEGIQQNEGMEQPVYYWDPVISPSGITFYNSDVIGEWKNNLFIASLSGMHICRLVIENNRVVGEERLLADQDQRFRDITQGRDGALYAVTDGGRLYKISKK